MPAQWKRAPPQRPRRRVCLSPALFARQSVRGARSGAGWVLRGQPASPRPDGRGPALPCGSRAAAWVWSRRLLRSVFARGGRQARRPGSPFPRQWTHWKARGFGERPEALPNEPVFRRVRPFLTGPQGGQEVRVKGATPPCGGRGGNAPCPVCAASSGAGERDERRARERPVGRLRRRTRAVFRPSEARFRPCRCGRGGGGVGLRCRTSRYSGE